MKRSRTKRHTLPRRPVCGVLHLLVSTVACAAVQPAAGTTTDSAGSGSEVTTIGEAQTTVAVGTSDASDDGSTTGPCPSEVEWTGDLILDDSTDAGDLECVVRIDGSLTIGPSTQLAAPLPLARLREVTGEVTIAANDALGSLDGLGSLERIGGLLKISENDALTTVAALSGLSSLAGVSFFDNPTLLDLTVFAPSIEFTAGESGVVELSIFGLPALTDLDGLAHVTEVVITGRLQVTVQSNELLSDIAGVAAFFPDGAAANLALVDLPSLAEVRLDGVADIGYLLIQESPSLTSVAGLADLTQAEAVEILGAASLESLAGLEHLSSVVGKLSLGGCGGAVDPLHPSGLQELDGLSGLEMVGRLEITGQPALLNLAGLSQTMQIGELLIRNNALLPEPEALDYLAAVMPSGDTSVCGNAGGMVCGRENPCPPLPD